MSVPTTGAQRRDEGQARVIDNSPAAYRAAAIAVLDLHKPVEVEPSDTICRECSFQLPNGRYFGRLEEWPCPTVRAVESALGGAA